MIAHNPSDRGTVAKIWSPLCDSIIASVLKRPYINLSDYNDHPYDKHHNPDSTIGHQMIGYLMAVRLGRFWSSKLIETYCIKNTWITKNQGCISCDNYVLQAQDLSAQVVLFDSMFYHILLYIIDTFFSFTLGYIYFTFCNLALSNYISIAVACKGYNTHPGTSVSSYGIIHMVL